MTHRLLPFRRATTRAGVVASAGIVLALNFAGISSYVEDLLNRDGLYVIKLPLGGHTWHQRKTV